MAGCSRGLSADMPPWCRKSSYHGSDWSNRSSDQSFTTPTYTMNRSLSVRSNNKASGGIGPPAVSHRVGFSFSSLRRSVQPELSRKLYRLIKTTNRLVSAHETAGRDRLQIATQLSEWGEQAQDDGISDISDKVGVILSEIGEQEDAYAHALDEARRSLKHIRDTEKSVQPSRDGKRKIADEIAKLKSKEPQSARLVILEQELVRAEAENLVAEAQLTNMNHQKLKEAYDTEFLATIERAEKQIILARHGRRLLRLLDDSAVVPGHRRRPYAHGTQARQILNDAEDDLRDWQPEPDDGGLANKHHDVIVHQTESSQLQSPALSSIGTLSPGKVGPGRLGRSPPSQVASSPMMQNTAVSKPQVEHELAGKREDLGSKDRNDAGGQSHSRGVSCAENVSPSPQHKLEGGSTIATGSPVSSLDGWRQTGDLVRKIHKGIVF